MQVQGMAQKGGSHPRLTLEREGSGGTVTGAGVLFISMGRTVMLGFDSMALVRLSHARL